MNNDQGYRSVMLPFGPSGHQIHDDRRGRNDALVGGGRDSRIFQKRLVFAEHEIQERFLRVDTTRFAENIEIFVILVYLPVRDRKTVGTTRQPRFGQRTRLKYRSGVI